MPRLRRAPPLAPLVPAASAQRTARRHPQTTPGLGLLPPPPSRLVGGKSRCAPRDWASAQTAPPWPPPAHPHPPARPALHEQPPSPALFISARSWPASRCRARGQAPDPPLPPETAHCGGARKCGRQPTLAAAIGRLCARRLRRRIQQRRLRHQTIGCPARLPMPPGPDGTWPPCLHLPIPVPHAPPCQPIQAAVPPAVAEPANQPEWHPASAPPGNRSVLCQPHRFASGICSVSPPEPSWRIDCPGRRSSRAQSAPAEQEIPLGRRLHLGLPRLLRAWDFPARLAPWAPWLPCWVEMRVGSMVQYSCPGRPLIALRNCIAARSSVCFCSRRASAACTAPSGAFPPPCAGWPGAPRRPATLPLRQLATRLAWSPTTPVCRPTAWPRRSMNW